MYMNLIGRKHSKAKQSSVFAWNEVDLHMLITCKHAGEPNGTVLLTTSGWCNWCCIHYGALQTTDGAAGPDKDCGRMFITAGVCHQGRRRQPQGELVHHGFFSI